MKRGTRMQRRTEMSGISISTAAPEELVLTALTHLMRGQIEEVTASFAEEFRFKDQGIGLEFTDKQRLAEFLQKARDLYPDSSLQTDNVFVSGDHVIIEWTLQTAITEPFYAGLTRKRPISLPGASIVRTEDGKITSWSDYYDGLVSRRTALASYFTEWLEY